MDLIPLPALAALLCDAHALTPWLFCCWLNRLEIDIAAAQPVNRVIEPTNVGHDTGMHKVLQQAVGFFAVAVHQRF